MTLKNTILKQLLQFHNVSKKYFWPTTTLTRKLN